MKQAAFVVIGTLVSIVVYVLLCCSRIEGLLHMGGCAGMAPAFLIIAPVSLVVGGMVTGFLSRPLMDTRLSLLWIAPGLYLGIVISCTFFCFAILDVIAGDVKYVDNEILWMLLFLLYLYLASLFGVWLGYFLRGLISNHRESD